MPVYCKHCRRSKCHGRCQGQPRCRRLRRILVLYSFTFSTAFTNIGHSIHHYRGIGVVTVPVGWVRLQAVSGEVTDSLSLFSICFHIS